LLVRHIGRMLNKP